MAKKIAQSGWAVVVSAAAALAGLVFYLVTSLSGFLAGSTTNLLPILCTVLALVAALALMMAGSKLGATLVDVLVVAAALLLIAAFALFVIGRVPLVADIYFIPVNYPQTEVTALNLSFVGLGCYLVSIIAMVAAAFSKKVGGE